jgi:starch synthase
MQVLHVTSEVFPLIKTGGLGDVSGALPGALRTLGVDARVLVPGYPQVLDGLPEIHDAGMALEILPGFHATLRQGCLPEGEPLYVLDCPKLYMRAGGPYSDIRGYDWPDNALRFGALCKMAALLGNGDNSVFSPDIIHCHDWPTGLVPVFIDKRRRNAPQVLMSIHNMAHQGMFAPEIIPILGLPWEGFNIHGYEFNSLVSFLKAGLFYSDWIGTVSPTYAQEIQTPHYGHGLHGLMQIRREHIRGIINGIDTHTWNPQNDSHLVTNYNASSLSKKAQIKKALRQRLELNPDASGPILGIVTRLTYQKGIDLLLPILPQILQQGAQLVILGLGERPIEHELQKIAGQYPGAISLNLSYDEELSHQITAGSDIFLMPSRFEPCGLTQMYSMRYGTLPLVRHTGGLADTVTDTTPASLDQGTATGFVFEGLEPNEAWHTLLRAMLVFRDKNTWKQIQRTAMAQDFSWEHSAQQYLELYLQMLEE